MHANIKEVLWQHQIKVLKHKKEQKAQAEKRRHVHVAWKKPQTKLLVQVAKHVAKPHKQPAKQKVVAKANAAAKLAQQLVQAVLKAQEVN